MLKSGKFRALAVAVQLSVSMSCAAHLEGQYYLLCLQCTKATPAVLKSGEWLCSGMHLNFSENYFLLEFAGECYILFL